MTAVTTPSVGSVPVRNHQHRGGYMNHLQQHGGIIAGANLSLLLMISAGTVGAQTPAPGYQYAAKIVCGLQKDPQAMILTRGFYATTVNIHNPNNSAVTFT